MGILAGRTTSTATTNESLWAEHVRAWRASGEPVAKFVQGRDDSASALRSWAQRLGPAEPSPRFVRVVPSKPTPAPAAGASELVLEVGAVRVRVAPGFDPALLADVVRALEGGAVIPAGVQTSVALKPADPRSGFERLSGRVCDGIGNDACLSALLVFSSQARAQVEERLEATEDGGGLRSRGGRERIIRQRRARLHSAFCRRRRRHRVESQASPW